MTEAHELDDDKTEPRPRPARRAAARSESEADATVVVPRVDPDATVVTRRSDPDATVATGRPASGTPTSPPIVEQGAAPWTARVYGARPIPTPSGENSDAIEQRIGPPPPVDAAPTVAPRPPMPALQRRFRRGRIVSLVAYAGAIVVAVSGLSVVAGIAFG